MPLVVSQWGTWLNALRMVTAETVLVHLYQSNTTPFWDMDLTDFAECDFAGYASQPVAPGDWVYNTMDVATRQIYVAPVLTWSRSTTGAPQNIYGYYVTGASPKPPGTGVLWAERFLDGPYVVQFVGDSIAMQPTFSSRSEFGFP